jgi:hypothetical protein
MSDRLANVLQAVGKETLTYESKDGTRVLILPYGGRVLGVFPKGSDQNFYWTNTALDAVETAKEFFESDDWKNSGGDRTWIAPEVDVFFPRFPDRSIYFQPRGLDPGTYRVERDGGRMTLINDLSLTLSRSNSAVDLRITKSFGSASNPLRHEKSLGIHDVDFAGYAQYTSLEITGGDLSRPVGLWNLAQMPHGGDLLIPTYSKTIPKHVFSTTDEGIPSTDILVSDRLVRYKMRQVGEHKIEIRAVATTGRIGYVYNSGDAWSLIVRNFHVNPSGEYVDVPWTDTDDFGYCAQACNINSALGTFSELEYHIPAIGGDSSQTRCDDTTQVWAFRGGKEAIIDIARVLISPEA